MGLRGWSGWSRWSSWLAEPIRLDLSIYELLADLEPGLLPGGRR